jgi:hypothetical protein
MLKISTIFALGVLVILVPFSGFPLEWKNFLYVASGIVIAGFSVLIRKELHEVLRHLHGDEVKTESYTENSPKQENPVENK